MKHFFFIVLISFLFSCSVQTFENKTNRHLISWTTFICVKSPQSTLFDGTQSTKEPIKIKEIFLQYKEEKLDISHDSSNWVQVSDSLCSNYTLNHITYPRSLHPKDWDKPFQGNLTFRYILNGKTKEHKMLFAYHRFPQTAQDIRLEDLSLAE